jgi:thioredoxin-related protein
MKRIFMLLVVLFVALTGFARGINFERGSFKSVMEKALQTGKPVFVDVYTTWCEPCKRMSDEIFPLSEVGQVYNESFLCYQLDAESSEGLRIAGKYKVTSYPTYLFLKPDGTVYYRFLGYMPVALFMKQTQYGLSEFADSKPIEEWVKDYPKHKLDTAFLRGYMIKRANLKLPSMDLLSDYIKLLPPAERTPEVLGVLYKQESSNLRIGTYAFDFLLQNYPAFAASQGYVIYKALDDAVSSSAAEAAWNQDRYKLHRAVLTCPLLPSSKSFLYTDQLYINYYRRTGEKKSLMKYIFSLCDNQLMKLSVDSLEQWDKAFQEGQGGGKARSKKEETAKALNTYAREVCSTAIWNDTIASTLRWSNRSLEWYPENTTFMSTKACILYKQRKVEEALALERKVLTLLKPASKEYKAQEELIQKMLTGGDIWTK